MDQHTIEPQSPKPTDSSARPQQGREIDDRDRKIRLLNEALSEALARLDVLSDAA